MSPPLRIFRRYRAKSASNSWPPEHRPGGLELPRRPPGAAGGLWAIRHDVVFRTSPHGVLAQLAHPTEVAFEIDDIDQNRGAGWSVLVEGVPRPLSRRRNCRVNGVTG